MPIKYKKWDQYRSQSQLAHIFDVGNYLTCSFWTLGMVTILGLYNRWNYAQFQTILLKNAKTRGFVVWRIYFKYALDNFKKLARTRMRNSFVNWILARTGNKYMDTHDYVMCISLSGQGENIHWIKICEKQDEGPWRYVTVGKHFLCMKGVLPFLECIHIYSKKGLRMYVNFAEPLIYFQYKAMPFSVFLWM